MTIGDVADDGHRHEILPGAPHTHGGRYVWIFPFQKVEGCAKFVALAVSFQGIDDADWYHHYDRTEGECGNEMEIDSGCETKEDGNDG